MLALFSITELLLFKIILVHMFACFYMCMDYSSAKKIENRNPAPSEGVAEGSAYGCVCRGAGGAVPHFPCVRHGPGDRRAPQKHSSE